MEHVFAFFPVWFWASHPCFEGLPHGVFCLQNFTHLKDVWLWLSRGSTAGQLLSMLLHSAPQQSGEDGGGPVFVMLSTVMFSPCCVALSFPLLCLILTEVK